MIGFLPLEVYKALHLVLQSIKHDYRLDHEYLMFLFDNGCGGIGRFHGPIAPRSDQYNSEKVF